MDGTLALGPWEAAVVPAMIDALAPLLSDEGWPYASLPPQEPGDPGRFHALFGRDSLITALQVLPGAPEVARATLRALAARQGAADDPETDEEPGKILHEYRPEAPAYFAEHGWPVRDGALLYYGTADATSWFLIVLDALGDAALAAELEPAWRAAGRLARADARRGRRLRPLRTAPRPGRPGAAGLARRDGAGHGASARRRHPAARTAPSRSRRSRTPTARPRPSRRSTRSARLDPGGDWPARAAALRGAARRVGAGRARRRGGRHAGARRRLVARLAAVGRRARGRRGRRPRRTASSAPDVLTGYGLRTLAASDGAFSPHAYHRGAVWPFDSWLGWGGLRAAGRDEAAERVRTGVLAALDRLGRAPELYAVTRGRRARAGRRGQPRAGLDGRRPLGARAALGRARVPNPTTDGRDCVRLS